MKNQFKWILLFPALIGGWLMPARACNLSSYTLVSATVTSGPTYTFVTQLCIGYGRTGVVFGADGPTNAFFTITVFSGQYTPAAMQAALVGWTYNLVQGTGQNTAAVPIGPRTFTADPSLNDPNNGYFYGPNGVGFTLDNEVDNIFYADPSACYCGDYTCISTTADCGNVGQICQNITLTYSGIYPDSLRALGIEGAAPFGGCWPNSDMLIVLPVLPLVWGDFVGVSDNGGVNLTWDTYEENGTKDFVVTRAQGFTGEFTEVGRVKAKGETDGKTNYTFFDAHPLPGLNAYQLQQIDEDGQMTESAVIYVQYSAPLGLSITRLYPNPVQDELNVFLSSDEDQAASLSLSNEMGQVIWSEETSLQTGANEHRIDLSSRAAGIYFLKVKTANAALETKVLKI